MSKTNGNAFVYVLISVVLLGLLTYILANSDSQTPISDRDEGVIAAQVAEILGYAASVSNVYSQMEQTGTDIDELNLILPASATFNTAPTNHKLFHPDGGGLAFKDDTKASFIDQSCASLRDEGWRFNKTVNWEWSKSASKDLFANLLCVRQDVCKAINKKITGSDVVPASLFGIDNVFSNGASDFIAVSCPECERYPSLCISTGGGTISGYVFYNLIKSR